MAYSSGHAIAMKSNFEENEIQDWVISKLSETLGVKRDQIDTREAFSNYGIDSVMAVAISGDLEEWMGCRLSATLLYDYPTIEALSRYLAQKAHGTD